MSTAVDSRQRSGIWSYIPSFGVTSPRRRSVSLPYRATTGDTSDPFEKTDRHSGLGLAASPTLLESMQNTWMTQSQRARYLKTGAILAFVLLVLFYVSGERHIERVGSKSAIPLFGAQLTKIRSKFAFSFYLTNQEMYEALR